MKYYAQKAGVKFMLARSDQMQGYLDQGAAIYSVDDQGKETLIANSEHGFIVDPPVFPVTHTVKIGGGSNEEVKELRQVLNILLGLED